MADPDYFTTAEFQELPDCGQFDEEQILPAAAHFTTIVEREVGVPFIPREVTYSSDGGSGVVIVPHAHVREVTSLTVDGVEVDPELVSLTYGVLRYLDGSGWACGVSNVVVTYTAGEYEECPADIKSAVMWATRDRLISQNGQHTQDPRQSSMTNDLGGSTTWLLPGEKRPTGYPELDALIASYLRTTPSYGFA